MQKPYLLLDVDGVLNPFPTHPHSEPPDGYHSVGILWVSEANGRRIRALMEDFEIVWCTAWGDEANAVISPLHNLPQFPVISLSQSTFLNSIHWKFDAIEDWSDDKPYAFVDDDIRENGIRYAARRSKFVPTLWLPVMSEEGLTDFHVKFLKEWVSEVSAQVSVPGRHPAASSS